MQSQLNLDPLDVKEIVHKGNKISISHLGNKRYMYTISLNELTDPTIRNLSYQKVIIGFTDGTFESIEEMIKTTEKAKLLNDAGFIRLYSTMGCITIEKTELTNCISMQLHFESQSNKPQAESFRPDSFFMFYASNSQRNFLTILNIIEAGLNEMESVELYPPESLKAVLINTLVTIMGISINKSLEV